MIEKKSPIFDECYKSPQPSSMNINLLKNNDKEKNLKTCQRKRFIMHGKTKLRMTADFLLETMQVGRQWRNNIFKEMKEKNPVNLEFYTQ